MRLTIRELSSPDDYEQAERVQASAWGVDDYRGVTPSEILVAINDNGGAVLGAFEGKKMVGYSLLLPGYRHGIVYMYSHQTGVAQSYQSKGVGYLLKLKQRDMCLRRGFKMIAWTFDPLIGRNAYFNVAKLGVVARNYLVDYYGPMDDSINWGLPTDRFLCEWYLRPTPKPSKAFGGSMFRSTKAFRAIDWTEEEGSGFPLCGRWGIDSSAETILVDIPSDIVGLKKKSLDDARRWRDATREVFTRSFELGFAAVGLLKSQATLQYVLTRATLPENIFRGH